MDVQTKMTALGLAGFFTWRWMSPSDRQGAKNLLNRFLEGLARSAAAERARKEQERLPMGESAPALAKLLETPPSFSIRPSAAEIDQVDEASQVTGIGHTAIQEKDAKWRDVLVPPSVVLIVGKRGSGKSALGYRLLELLRNRAFPYVVGAPQQAMKLLPDWIGLVPTLEELPTKSVALIDEAYLRYHSRRSMADESTSMSQILNLSRQRDQTLIFVSQEARQVDRNVSSSANLVVFKEMGILQLDFERRELRKLTEEARQAIESVRGNRQPWSYVYAPDSDFLGLLENELPSFWKPGLSRIYATEASPAKPRRPERSTPAERAVVAKKMRGEGSTLSEIANALGVSKGTVVNYLKDYPYRPPRMPG